MPTDYEKDDARRLVRITTSDPYAFADILALVDRQWAEGAWEYAVLHDNRLTSQGATLEELQALVFHVRAVGKGQSRGPVAFTVPRDAGRFAKGLTFWSTARHEWDVEVLFTAPQLEEWLRRVAPKPSN